MEGVGKRYAEAQTVVQFARESEVVELGVESAASSLVIKQIISQNFVFADAGAFGSPKRPTSLHTTCRGVRTCTTSRWCTSSERTRSSTSAVEMAAPPSSQAF
ncbi:MAG: hypothetical protein ACI81R_001662 [Bradymonadia bacterium]|jgi:hypothetical protein